jgi:hypothetical protein
VNQSATEGGPRSSVDKWAEALSAAVKASHEFREADAKRQAGLIDEANAIVEGAMRSLKCRYGFQFLVASYLTICHAM